MRVTTLPADGLGGSTQFNGFSPPETASESQYEKPGNFPSCSVEGSRKSTHCELFWEHEVKWKLLSCIWLFATPWTVLPVSSVHGILQARILEWVAIPFILYNKSLCFTWKDFIKTLWNLKPGQRALPRFQLPQPFLTHKKEGEKPTNTCEGHRLTKRWKFNQLQNTSPLQCLISPNQQVSELESPSCVWLFATPWTVASQAPLFMEFSRQEYWSGLPFLSPKPTRF